MATEESGGNLATEESGGNVATEESGGNVATEASHGNLATEVTRQRGNRRFRRQRDRVELFSRVCWRHGVVYRLSHHSSPPASMPWRNSGQKNADSAEAAVGMAE